MSKLDERTPYGFTWREAIEALKNQQGLNRMTDYMKEDSRHWNYNPCAVPGCDKESQYKTCKYCVKHNDIAKELRAKKALRIRQSLHEARYGVSLPEYRQATRFERPKREILQQFEVRGLEGCVYCGGAFEHIDHVFPRSKGGSDGWENLVPSCARCNGKKSACDPWIWLSVIHPDKDFYQLLESWGVDWTSWPTFQV